MWFLEIILMREGNARLGLLGSHGPGLGVSFPWANVSLPVKKQRPGHGHDGLVIG